MIQQRQNWRQQACKQGQAWTSAYVVSGGTSPPIKRLDGGRREQGVSSTSVTEPTPASTMFFATCGGERGEAAPAGNGVQGLAGCALRLVVCAHCFAQDACCPHLSS
jgi:hypothetical protein